MRISLHGPIKSKEKKEFKFPCEDCDERFTSKVYLNKHKKKDHKIDIKLENQRQCEICSKILPYQYFLERHMRTHDVSRQRPHKCEVCGSEFTHKQYLKDHIDSIHFGLKKYQCYICGKSYNRASNLRDHKKIHDRIKVKSSF